MKLLSIITINYNNDKGLALTLASILQYKKDFVELIVIDGGSSDNSIDVIKENKEKIDYWVSEPDKGIYNAMNKGILQAKGKYIMFVNSGDILLPSVNYDDFLKNTDSKDIIYFNLEINEGVSKYIKTYPTLLDFKYFAEDSLAHTGTLIKKELFNQYGLYDETFKIVADWAFFMDCILLYTCTYKHVDECFASFSLDGISSDINNRQLLQQERNRHIENKYPLYNSLYREWMNKKDELYKLKNAISVKYLRKIGFLRWLN